MTAIKICGITRAEDAQVCVDLGVEYLGFNFYPKSKRRTTPEQAAAIIAELPEAVTPVALFVDADLAEAKRILATSGCRMAQCHGHEDAAFCVALGVPIIRALPLQRRDDLAIAAAWQTEFVLLDSAPAGQGGSGVAVDWTLAADFSDKQRLFLAGGLLPGNVAEALRIADPYAVDVASGVESAPGIKSAQSVEEFVKAVRSVR